MRKKVKLNNKYTMQEFLAAMQTRTWSAGTPYAAKISGITPIIVFPELDESHQLWLQIADGLPYRKEPIPTNIAFVSYGAKARDFGEDMARGAIINHTIGGTMASLISKASSNEKKVKQQVLTLVEELKNSGL